MGLLSAIWFWFRSSRVAMIGAAIVGVLATLALYVRSEKRDAVKSRDARALEQARARAEKIRKETEDARHKADSRGPDATDLDVLRKHGLTRDEKPGSK